MSSFKICRVCFSSEGVCISHTALFQSFTRILVYHKSANKSALYTYFYSTVTLFARFLGLSTSRPFATET